MIPPPPPAPPASHPLLALALAVCSAFCYALAAAVQRREVALAAGEGFFAHLVRRPRWWGGVAAMATGAAIHVAALNFASVALVQPIGVAALVLALPLDARWERRTVTRAEWASAAVLVAALAGLLALAPHHGGNRPPAPGAVVFTVALVVGVVVLIVVGGSRLRVTPRAVSRAAAAGICAGATSAMVRLTLRLLATDGGGGVVLISGVAAVTLPVVGLALLQIAYRDGGLDAGLATQTAIDPAVATAIGIALLDERFDGGPTGAVFAGLFGVVVVAALVALIRNGPGSRTGLTAERAARR